MIGATPSITAIRAALPAVTATAYLNTGTYGPLPAAAHAALATRQGRDYERGRFVPGGFQEVIALKSEIRAAGARLLGADPAEIAITHGTTYGMNLAIWGLDWRPDDEIVTTNVEHIGGLAAAYLLRERLGVRVRFADCRNPDTVLDAIRAEITPRTRVVAFSHVAWGNGYVFPVAEITDLAHSVGALAIVDAAQSAGAIAVDVRALGVDAYAAPGQKWLCGPGDTGLLYVAAAALDRLNGSFGSHGSFASFDEEGAAEQHADARRFEMGTGYVPLVHGFRASLSWLLDEAPADWAYPRVLALADLTRDRLTGVQGVTVETPPGTRSGLTFFTFAGWEPQAVTEELAERDVVIRSLKHPPGLRVSTGFYNDEDDIDRLVAALTEVRGLEPHPARTTGG
jgi:L-cysteine/cystine lyase